MSYTSISGVIDFSVRQVIDILGNGANNSDLTVTLARDEALPLGITIDGLLIASNGR